MMANLQLSTKDGEVSIKLELQLGMPGDIKPGLAAAGHPAGTVYCPKWVFLAILGVPKMALRMPK